MLDSGIWQQRSILFILLNLQLWVPKCEIFNCSGFHDFYIIKAQWGWLWGRKKNCLIFRCSFRAAKLLTRLLAQSNFKEDLFCVGQKNFLQSFWGHLLVSIAIFAVLGYWKYWIPYAHAPTFMHTLSIQVRNRCTPWPYASFPWGSISSIYALSSYCIY